MKNFLSKNLTSIIIGILIILGFLQSDILPFGSSSEKPLRKGDFFVHNHSAIHAIYYQGNLNYLELKNIADFMNQMNLFEDNKPAVLGIIKTEKRIDFLRMTSAEYQKGVPEEFLYRYSWVVLMTKSDLFPDHYISLKFTDDQWIPRQTLDETQIKEIVEIYKGNSINTTFQTSEPTALTSTQKIFDRWMNGATNLAKARYYYTVESNENWRIYYSDLVAEQVSSLAYVLAEANFFQPNITNYIAFYTLSDPDYFDGDAAYAVAIPFTETQLDDGTTSKSLEVIHNYLKDAYFSQVNLLTIGTDFDFIPQLIRY
jgi:hypothetical protein